MDQAQETAFLKGNSCTDPEVCREVDRQQFRLLAEHWNDKMKIDHKSVHDPKTGWPVWRSADLLTSYSWEDPVDLQRNVTATQTICKPVEAPYSLKTLVRCTKLFSEFDGYSKKPATVQKPPKDESWAGNPETVSRYAVEKVARSSGVVLLPGLTLEECDKIDEDEGLQSTACEWSEPSGMQSFYIQLARARVQHPLSEMDKVPWELAGWDGTTCVAVGQ
jgi:hypothetical protein